jgi:sec-independent protein translocase protein TatB
MFPEGRAVELLIAAVVALIVVGPKDLPILLRRLGQFMAKLRGMAAEFRASFDEMARQSELDELRKEVEALRHGQLTDAAAKAAGDAHSQIIDEINQGLTDVGVQLHPPMGYQYVEPAPESSSQPAPATTIAVIEPEAKPKPKRKPAAKPKTAAAKSPARTAKKPAAKSSAAKPRAAAKPRGTKA